MKFIVMNDLKRGMRLARPVYNKEGVMLYDVNTKLNKQGVNSIKNFGLLGVYILEPTEPAPDITEEEREFERFQTMTQFELMKELDMLVLGTGEKQLQKLADSVIKKYGNLDHKINFNKTLRSSEDYAYKHALSVAILCALMSSILKMSYMEQLNIVMAALVHEIGRTMVPLSILKKGTKLNQEDIDTINKYELDGINLVQNNFEIPSLTRIMVAQNYKELTNTNTDDVKLLDGTKMLRVADAFDTMTSMNVIGEPASDVIAIRHLLDEKNKFDERSVGALLKSINILVPGVCVELTNKEKGLVIKENKDNILRPIVLGFEDNQVYDLSNDYTYMKVRIFDIMKTMDMRVPISQDIIDKYIEMYRDKE